MLGARIYVDAEVIEALRRRKARAGESMSDVLRRLLRLPPSGERRGRKPRKTARNRTVCREDDSAATAGGSEGADLPGRGGGPRPRGPE